MISQIVASVKHAVLAPSPAGGTTGESCRAHVLRDPNLGHVFVALYLTVAQELAHEPTTFASPGGGRICRCRRDRRVHTDDTGLERPQHFAGAQRLGDEQGGAARQQQSAADQLGDAAESADEPGRAVATGVGGAQPEWAVDEPQWRDDARDRHEHDEGEDALTG